MKSVATLDRSPLEFGVLVTFITLGIAGIVGLIAVIDADNDFSAFGIGFGVAFTTFVAGGTIASALACLKRRRLELPALGSILAAGLAIDLLVLAVWLDIDSEAYGKIAVIAFVWSLFALLILGLTLAAGALGALARLLFLGAVTVTVVAGLISTWLIATTGGSVYGVDLASPVGVVGDEGLLRALAVCFVLMSVLWFGTLAASRLEPEAEVTR